MNGVGKRGETGKRGNEERGIGDKQRGNGLDRETGKELNCAMGYGETMEQWNGGTEIPIWGATGRK